MKVYLYVMRLRGFAPGCQPKHGFIERREDNDLWYHDIIIYSRELTMAERYNYDLDYLGEEQMDK